MGSYVCFPVRYGYMAVLSMAALVAVRKERDADDFHTENVCKHPAGLRLRCVLLLVASAVSALGAVCLTLIWEERLVQAFSSLAISKVCPKETAVTAVVLLLVGVSAWCGQKVLHAKTSGEKTGGAGFPGMAVLGALVGGFCVYTMILLPPDYAVRQENEAAYRQMTEIAKQAENENAASAELSWLLAREADRDDLPTTLHWWTGKARSADTFRPKANRQRRFWKVSVILHPGFRCVPSAERKFPIQCCAMCLYSQRKLWGSRAATAYFAISVPGQSYCLQRMLKRNIDRLLKKSRAWM